MYFKSKKASLIILGLTAVVSSRTMFMAFDDPEGPNLLIIAVGAAIVYGLSWAAYARLLSGTGLKRLLLAVSIQVIIVTVSYFILA